MHTVRSKDGTSIAYWTSGDGPPILLVHGTAGVHDRFAPLLPHLEPHATVHVMDRRGRGASGDAPDHDLTREFEDVAAVVDSIAGATGSPVCVYGHSYGGNCAFGAAQLTTNIRGLVLYEGWPPVKPDLVELPPEAARRLDELVAAGDLEGAIVTLVREIVHVSEAELAAVRAQPTWPARVATAHTITRELRALSKYTFDAADAAKVTVPVLLLTGSESPDGIRDDPDTFAAALPDSRIVVIEGQAHIADVLVPDVFSGHLLSFLRELG